MQIVSIGVSGFRQLVDVHDIPLGRPTVLTGANGAGKSTFIRALRVLLDGQIDDRDTDEADYSVDGTFEVRAEDDLPGLAEGDSVRLRRLVDSHGAVALERFAAVAAREELRAPELRNARDLRALVETNGIPAEGDLRKKDVLVGAVEEFAAKQAQVEAWVECGPEWEAALPRLIAFSSTEEPDPEAEVRTSLGATFKAFKEDPDYRRGVEALEESACSRLRTDADAIREMIAKRCPDLGAPRVQPGFQLRESFNGVELQIGDAGHSLAEMGAGERRRVTLAVWEATAEVLRDISREGGDGRQLVIAYDEPDTHLDYGRQRDLMALILEQAQDPNARVVVATHSQNLIDGVDPEGIVAFEGVSSSPKVTRAGVFLGDAGALAGHLQAVAASLGLRNSVLLNERCFVVVEGESEEVALPVLYRLVNGRRCEARGVVFFSADSNSAALALAGLLKKHGRQVRVLVDQDTRDHASTRKFFSEAALRAAGFEENEFRFVGASSGVDELEAVFTDGQWTQMLNERYPKRDENEWVAREITELRSAPKFSDAIKRAVNAELGFHPPKPEMMRFIVEGCATEQDVPMELSEAMRWLDT
jgi:putative ATP-dependent endonuclease of OLD family